MGARVVSAMGESLPCSSHRVAARMGSLNVRRVQSRRDLNAFIKLPFRLHRGTPWVPPVLMERREFLNRYKNPFFQHAEAECLLAERDGDVVGRITAQVDERWTQ